MSASVLVASRFVRRTQLGPNEYRKNFRQIDGDIIAAVTSREADRITPLMSKIYLRLAHAQTRYWEREGVLRFEGELRDDCYVKAWDALCEELGVASATARKALRWMHEQGLIGYFAGKNGVGIRIFLNRAASSIGIRRGQKILAFSRASSVGARASRNEAAFSDSSADLEVSDIDFNPGAPKNGAEQTEVVEKLSAARAVSSQPARHGFDSWDGPKPQTPLWGEGAVEGIVSRLKRELEPLLQSAARRAAVQENERTREWLESRGLPKVARVAQREAFNVMRKYGMVTERSGASHAEVGRADYAPAGPQPLTDDEVIELAQACVSILEAQGQPIEVTLSEMSTEAGGFLLPVDAPRVRRKAQALLDGSPTAA